MKKFKILKSVYIDKDGEEKAPYYFIQKEYRILWLSLWTTITHEDYTSMNGGKTITKFDTYDDAYDFIVNILAKNKIRQRRVNELISQVDC